MRSAERYFFIVVFVSVSVTLQAQQKVLTLKGAVDIALANYGTIKAKGNYVNASRSNITGTMREYLPDLNVSAQQDYGTINGISGPLYGLRGLSASSAGPALSTQNWTAAFGALYLANVNWDFFSFGRLREKIEVSKSALARDQSDLEQEKFQQEVRVAGAYLNLLAAQRLTRSQRNNLERTNGLRNVVVARTLSGLNPGVDSSLANAEVSSAKIALTRSRDFEQEQEANLLQAMGVPARSFELDSFFLSRIPTAVGDSIKQVTGDHPVLNYYRSLIVYSDRQAKYFRTFNYPSFSLFGIIQSRGSGFGYNYGEQAPEAYSPKYTTGVKPTRGNYLAGIGFTWNLSTPFRVQQQVQAQHYISLALKDQFDLADQQLNTRLELAKNKMRNAMENYREAPIQVKAATDAYQQKSVLYKNGLDNIVNITQALYTLNRAETDRDIAYSNVWQALLLQAAASGDFGLFINEF